MANTVKKVQHSTVPYYGVAVVWAVYALLFDLYKVSHYIIVGVLSIVIFIILKILCKDSVVDVVTGDDKLELEMTGNEEIDEVIKKGQETLNEMHEIKSRIGNEKIADDVSEMEDSAKRIFEHVRDNPQKLHQIRHFLDYYLPITLKLLKAYDSLNSTGISGKNINATKAKIAEIMGIITTAFDAQLDKLFGSEAIDVSADIAVLENMLSREGLIGEQLEADTTTDENGADIQLKM